MASALELFLNKMAAETGAASNTLAAYQKDIEQFLSTLQILPEQITAENISFFIQSLTDRHFAIKSIHRKSSAIKGFCKFLVEEKILKTNPLPDITIPKKEKTLPKFLTPAQVQTLYQAALSHQNKNFNRTGTVIKLMFATGLRISEALSLPICALNLQKKQIFVKGKGGKERILFFDEETNKILDDYVQNTRPFFIRHNVKSKFLFPSKTALQGHLTRDAFFKSLKKLGIECGMSPSLFSPHSLRHAFATNLINHDADLRSVQKLLGHEKISTTEIYTHISHQKLIDSVLSKHPLQKLNTGEHS